MTRLTENSIRRVLTEEIKWHRDHPDGSCCGESFENGFISGLSQAKRLVFKILRDGSK